MRRRSLQRGVRAVVALGVVAAALGLATQAWDELHAEVVFLSSSQALKQGDAAAARDAAQRALAMHPRDYAYLERAALIEDGMQRPQHARQLWLAALAQRPGSPYPWARLAQWQLDHGDVRAPLLERSIAQVRRLGEHERGLWKLFAAESLQHWNQDLPPPVRATLKQWLLQESAARQQALGRYALANRQETVLCGVWEEKDGPQPWCDQMRQIRQSCDGGGPLNPMQRQWCARVEALPTQYPPG
ncbi:MAG TPA: hypothetical protein VLI06_07295 [Solimonas sp.]|nr:hypothetical protein [Solimonas sp.]